MPISESLKLSLRKWCLEKHKAQFSGFQLSLFASVCRETGVFKNPSVVCSLSKEWAMVKLSFVKLCYGGTNSANSDTGIASKLNLGKVKLAFCRENSVKLPGEEIYMWLSNVTDVCVVIFFGFELIVGLLLLGCKIFTKPEKYQLFS